MNAAATIKEIIGHFSLSNRHEEYGAALRRLAQESSTGDDTAILHSILLDAARGTEEASDEQIARWSAAIVHGSSGNRRFNGGPMATAIRAIVTRVSDSSVALSMVRDILNGQIGRLLDDTASEGLATDVLVSCADNWRFIEFLGGERPRATAVTIAGDKTIPVEKRIDILRWKFGADRDQEVSSDGGSASGSPKAKVDRRRRDLRVQWDEKTTAWFARHHMDPAYEASTGRMWELMAKRMNEECGSSMEGRHMQNRKLNMSRAGHHDLRMRETEKV